MKFSSTVALQYDTPFSPFGAGEFEASLEWLKKSGFDGAEICISDYRTCKVEKVKEILDAYELGCSTISTGQSAARESLSLLQKGIALQETKERLRQHIDAAEILGSKVTIGLLRGVGSPGMCIEEMRYLAQHMVPVVEYAEKRGVKLLLEPINHYETCILNQAIETKKFIQKELGGSKNVEILWDVFHANIEDGNFFMTLASIRQFLGHIHLADSNRWFPGYGHLDFNSILGAIQATGYSSYYSFECLNLPSAEVVRKNAGDFIRCMNNKFGT